MGDLYTHHTTASIERAYAEADVGELVGSWLMAHANLEILRELARRGITEQNARQLALELNIGIGAMTVEFRRRGLEAPEVAVRAGDVPPREH